MTEMRFVFVYLFLFIFFISIFFAFFSKWARIDYISFSGGKNSVIQELKKQTDSFIGVWFWEFSLQKLKKIVQAHPKVEQVQILRSWPNRYHVLLLSEKPVLILMGRKFFHPVTAQGNLLGSLMNPPDLPFLRGEVFFDQLDLRKQAVQLYLHLPEKGFFSRKNISEMKYSKKDQNFYLYLLQSGKPVRVSENLSEFRPDRVESVLKYLQQKKIKWRVIDARFSQKVIVSLDENS